MRGTEWYFDVISPYAFLQFRQLQELQLLDELTPRPVLFAGLLNHYGQLGPAEIPSKREFTYRQVLWLAERRGLTLRMPEKHPFNPLSLLRMIIARDNDWDSIESAFEFVWVDGKIPEDAEALAALLKREELSTEAISQPAVKQALRSNTEGAIENGVFGVPTLRAAGFNFWGQDATEMYLDHQRDPEAFAARHRIDPDSVQAAASRKRFTPGG